MNQIPRRRFDALKTRLALVVVGLALGFAARWISGLIGVPDEAPHFKPMPESAEVPEPARVPEPDGSAASPATPESD